MTFGVMTLLGAFQVGMVYAVRPSFEEGNHAGVIFFGVLSSALISGGLLPQFYEIYKFKEVKGVSMLFMCVDIIGGESLSFRPALSPFFSSPLSFDKSYVSH